MTLAFMQDFLERKRQVRHYLAVVSNTERQIDMKMTRVQEGRLLTLRAGTFLILYNLIEATTRGAMDAVHDKITTSGVHFCSLTLSLRKEVLRLFKKGADPAKDHTMDDFPAAFVAIALDQGISLSGNVDSRTIRKLAECYGFSSATSKNITRDGSDLLVIKTNRNDLAHGLKTYEEVGRNYTAVELMLLSRRTMRYMEDILQNISEYIDNRTYLEDPPT